MGELRVKEGETLLFIGGSIPACGRWGTKVPLGDGYVRIFTELVTVGLPERMIRYINKGIGGKKITDVKQRW